jgi:hypothetical protein
MNLARFKFGEVSAEIGLIPAGESGPCRHFELQNCSHGIHHRECRDQCRYVRDLDQGCGGDLPMPSLQRAAPSRSQPRRTQSGGSPRADRHTRLVLRARRFFCNGAICTRRIFAERFDGNVEPRARRTSRLDVVFNCLTIALGGERTRCCLIRNQRPRRPGWPTNRKKPAKSELVMNSLG